MVKLLVPLKSSKPLSANVIWEFRLRANWTALLAVLLLLLVYVILARLAVIFPGPLLATVLFSGKLARRPDTGAWALVLIRAASRARKRSLYNVFGCMSNTF